MISDISNKPFYTSSHQLTVILSSYNYADLLPNAIQAILSQSLQPDEFIIIDDASTDNSIEIIKHFLRDNQIIKFIQKDQNEGIVSALNYGLKLAKGHYITYASADDLVLPGLFEESINLLEKYPQAAFCSSLTTIIDEKGNQLGRWSSPVVSGNGYITPQDARRYMRIYGFWLMGNTAVFRRQSLIEEGGFLPKLGPLCDSFVAQVMALRHGACFIPEYLACWRRTENGYLMSTIADSRRSIEFMNTAQRLMRTKYKGLFPPGYAKRWEKEWLYATGLTAGKKNLRNHNDYLNSLKHALSPLNQFDHILFSVLKAFASTKILFIRFYLFVRLRQLSWDKVTRKIKSKIHVFTCWVKKKMKHF